MAGQVEVVEAVVGGPVVNEGERVGVYHADDRSGDGSDDDGTHEECWRRSETSDAVGHVAFCPGVDVLWAGRC